MFYVNILLWRYDLSQGPTKLLVSFKVQNFVFIRFLLFITLYDVIMPIVFLVEWY